MIKVLIFDVDGVLINCEMVSEKFSREYGVSIDKILPFFNGPFAQCLVGNADIKEVITPYLKEWGWKTGTDSFLNYWFKMEHNIDEELINYIQDYRNKGIRCFIATNQEKYRAEYMISELGFANSFDKLYASAHFGHKKTNIEFYKKLLNEIGNIKKDEILFWDDTSENIATAKEFGINAELYTSFSDFKEKMEKYFSN